MAYGSGKTHSYFPALRVMESPVSYPELAPETRWILQKPTYSSETPLLYEEVSFTAAVPSLCYGTSHGKAKKPMSWPRDQKLLPHHNGYVLMHWVGRKCERCAYWTFTSASEHQKKHTVVKPTSGLPCSLLLPPARGWGGGKPARMLTGRWPVWPVPWEPASSQPRMVTKCPCRSGRPRGALPSGRMTEV